MNDLIKRLDEWIPTVNIDRPSMHKAYNLIIDCRAEIERLSEELEEMKQSHHEIRARGQK
jgi:hypothetical protein